MALSQEGLEGVAANILHGAWGDAATFFGISVNAPITTKHPPARMPSIGLCALSARLFMLVLFCSRMVHDPATFSELVLKPS